MANRRWYPTATRLPDGRILAVSGARNNLSDIINVPEVYDPSTDTWTSLTAATNAIPLYPFLFVLPDGRVAWVGNSEVASRTSVLNLSTLQWTVVDNRLIDGGSAVQIQPGKFLKAGTAADSGNSGLAQSTAFTIDLTRPSPAWAPTGSMAFPRSFLNLTMLPDGSALATGGGTDRSAFNTGNAILPAEIWSPVTGTWTTMASMVTPRLYHSTALLLPDARVLVAGGGADTGVADQRTARDLLAAVSVQGRAADDRVRAIVGFVRDIVHGRHARQREHRIGRAGRGGVGDACLQPESSVPDARVRDGAERTESVRAREREPGDSRALHAVHREQQRRAVGRVVRHVLGHRQPDDGRGAERRQHHAVGGDGGNYRGGPDGRRRDHRLEHHGPVRIRNQSEPHRGNAGRDRQRSVARRLVRRAARRRAERRECHAGRGDDGDHERRPDGGVHYHRSEHDGSFRVGDQSEPGRRRAGRVGKRRVARDFVGLRAPRSSPCRTSSTPRRAAATTTITGAGLIVGTITTASSTTVPAGSVISQNPAAGAQVTSGSAVALVISSGPPATGTLTVDTTVSADGNTTVLTPPFDTAAAGELLVAFAAADGLSSADQTLTVSGAGLTWTLQRRANAQMGVSEIWTAVAPTPLVDAQVTATQTSTGFDLSLTVVAFRGASGTGASAIGRRTERCAKRFADDNARGFADLRRRQRLVRRRAARLWLGPDHGPRVGRFRSRRHVLGPGPHRSGGGSRRDRHDQRHVANVRPVESRGDRNPGRAVGARRRTPTSSVSRRLQRRRRSPTRPSRSAR